MFLVYQIRTQQVEVHSCPDLSCPLCGSRRGMELAIFQKYAWLLMPMWPEGKFGMASCRNCQQKIPNLKWTDELESRYYELKKQTGTPLSLWRGLFINPVLLALFLGVIVAAVYLLAQKNKSSQAADKNLLSTYIGAPEKGDLYRIAMYKEKPAPGFSYTYLRFVNISGDTLFVEKLKKNTTSYGDWNHLDTKEANAFEDKKMALDYNVFRNKRELMLVGEKTMHIFFKGVERADIVLDKN